MVSNKIISRVLCALITLGAVALISADAPKTCGECSMAMRIRSQAEAVSHQNQWKAHMRDAEHNRREAERVAKEAEVQMKGLDYSPILKEAGAQCDQACTTNSKTCIEECSKIYRTLLINPHESLVNAMAIARADRRQSVEEKLLAARSHESLVTKCNEAYPEWAVPSAPVRPTAPAVLKKDPIAPGNNVVVNAPEARKIDQIAPANNVAVNAPPEAPIKRGFWARNFPRFFPHRPSEKPTDFSNLAAQDAQLKWGLCLGAAGLATVVSAFYGARHGKRSLCMYWRKRPTFLPRPISMVWRRSVPAASQSSGIQQP